MKNAQDWIRNHLNDPDREESLVEVIRAIQEDAARDMRERAVTYVFGDRGAGREMMVEALPLLPDNELKQDIQDALKREEE